MRRHVLLVAVAAVLSGLVPAGAGAAERPEQFRQKVEDELAVLERRLEELDRRIDAARGEAKARLERALEELRKKRTVVRRQLEELEASGRAAWQELREGIEAALEELRKGLEAVREEVPVET
jgi:chromosome segregation ATPase